MEEIMVCEKCGSELRKGAKFCTKCGATFKNEINTPSPITSIVLSIIGIIGYWVMRYLIYNSGKTGNYSALSIYWVIAGSFSILLCVAIVVALIALNKQKSFLGFIGGLIPCANFIIVEGYYIIRNFIS
jgi:preprotein translocase subunit Sss1